MKKSLIPLLAPIISIFILTLGNGFYTTVTSLQLQYHHVSSFFIGVVSAAYFCGLVVGSHQAQRIINRIGHIRGYAFFASMMVVAILIQGLVFHPGVWLVVRFIGGYDLAGLFIVIESWMVAGADSSSKGAVLGFYLLTYYIAQSVSQLLVQFHSPSTLYSFVMVATLAAASIIPVSFTRFSAPPIDTPELLSVRALWKKVPLGAVSAFLGGVTLGVLYTIFPVFLLKVGQGQKEVAYLLFFMILAGGLYQLPIGKLSDFFDRRRMIMVVAIMSLIGSVLMLFIPLNFTSLLIFSVLIAALTFVVYPLSISHTSDYLSKSQSVPAISVLTILYGAGSAIGPLLISPVMGWWDNHGFFLVFVLMGFCLTAYTVRRLYVREAAPEEERVVFVPAMAEHTQGAQDVYDQMEYAAESEKTAEEGDKPLG